MKDNGKNFNFRIRELVKRVRTSSRGVELRENELYDCVIAVVERPLIEMVLEDTGGNQIKAARILGINRNTLHSRIVKLGIDVAIFKR